MNGPDIFHSLLPHSLEKLIHPDLGLAEDDRLLGVKFFQKFHAVLKLFFFFAHDDLLGDRDISLDDQGADLDMHRLLILIAELSGKVLKFGRPRC